MTGFFIPRADPPAAETDGPLGALFLARALVPFGVRVTIFVEANLVGALAAGLTACGSSEQVSLVKVPGPDQSWDDFLRGDWPPLRAGLTHLLALERVGPAHTWESLARQAGTTQDDLAHFHRAVPSTGL